MIANPPLTTGHGTQQAPVEDYRGHLENILAAPKFRNSPRSSLLLKYLVEETLNGDHEKLKGYAIGVNVFDRPDSFDPSVDPIVRVQMGRLRSHLESYYRSEGEADTIRISVPVGTNIPCFEPVGHGRIEQPARQRPFPGIWRFITQFRIILAAAPALMALVAVSWHVLWSTDSHSLAYQAPMVSTWPRVFIKRFQVHGTNPQLDAFADVLHHNVQNDLAKFSTLSIVEYEPGRTSQLAGSADNLWHFLLTGEIDRWQGDFKIHVKLTAAGSGEVFWSRFYALDLSASGQLSQSALAALSRRIANAVGAPLGPVGRKLTTRAAQSLEQAVIPHTCNLRVHAFLADQSEDNHRMAFACINRIAASARESNWWTAYSVLLLEQYRRGFSTVDVAQAAALALEAARKAVVLDADNAHAQLALAHAALTSKLPVEGETAIERAIATNPADDFVLARAAWAYSVLGDWERGEALSRRAMELNPSYPSFYHAISAIYHYRMRNFRKAVDVSAAFIRNDCPLSHAIYAAVLAKFDRAQAQELVDVMIAKYPNYASALHRAIERRRLPGDLLSLLRIDLAEFGVTL